MEEHSSLIPTHTLLMTVKDLSYSLPSSKFGHLLPGRRLNPADILKPVSFSARSAELLAVVGPSGAGKSTLLRVISGRVLRSGFDAGSVSLNGAPVRSPGQLRRLCGFVTQEDNLLPLLTVRETLMFSAKFRLNDAGHREREQRVNCLMQVEQPRNVTAKPLSPKMQELGLHHIADSYIGDEDTRGISGGERKRVAVAVDVIHEPPILLLDEPTSGLDSSSALHLIQLLCSMAAKRNQILILTIHQPSYRILKYISTFLLLSGGSAAHFGTLESLETSISDLGYRIPARVNPLEFAMEITRQLETEHNSKRSNSHPPARQNHSFETATKAGGYCSRLEEIGCLSWRFWKIVYRTKQLCFARTGQAVVGGLGLGSVFFHLKADEAGIAERLGFLAFTLSFLLSSTVEALPIFLQERRVIMRESSRRMYRLSSYMVANAVVTVPFLLAVAVLFAVTVYWLVGLNPSAGAFAFFVFVVWLIVLMASSVVLFLSAVSPDFVVGNYLICVFLGAFFLFSGYFIAKQSMPKYCMFMYYASLYRYPLDALLINEYWSDREKCFKWEGDEEDSVCLMNGGDVLRIRGLEGDGRWMNVGIMCGFFLIYRVLAWLVLVRRASKTML
ncbi:ABC transporter G family member 23 [Platanthera zijinensis]|uniref:ABC transporter G family member 23 n=1 Tax=Platanthera zijinensis TaxID=2320716 RepID=A0AAP0BRY2_9ASPA